MAHTAGFPYQDDDEPMEGLGLIPPSMKTSTLSWSLCYDKNHALLGSFTLEYERFTVACATEGTLDSRGML